MSFLRWNKLVLSVMAFIVGVSLLYAQATPGLRDSHVLLYHAGLDQVILMHGLFPDTSDLERSEVWGWDGEAWNLLSDDGPAPRLLGGTTYDSTRDRVVVFGGVSRGDEKRNDTWEWDGETWMQMDADSTAPSPRDHIMMVYDEAHGYSLFFGGFQGETRFFEDTWGWDGETWTQLATSGPTARAHYSLVYDPAREQVLMFGGITAALQPLDETWIWDGDAWSLVDPTDSQPSARDATRIAYDQNTDTLLLFGGRSGRQVLGDTWRWDGERWKQLEPDNSPSPRAFHDMVYDPNRERIILYGGWEGRNRSLADFWEWDGETWIEVTDTAKAE